MSIWSIQGQQHQNKSPTCATGQFLFFWEVTSIYQIVSGNYKYVTESHAVVTIHPTIHPPSIPSIYKRPIRDQKTDLQALHAHEVDPAVGFAHIVADAHSDDYSWPPGASLKLSSRDLAKRGRGRGMRCALEWGKMSDGESPWILTGCTPGRTPIMCLRRQSPTASFRSLRSLSAWIFSEGNLSAFLHFTGRFFGAGGIIWWIMSKEFPLSWF